MTLRHALAGTGTRGWLFSLVFSGGLLLALFYNVDHQALRDLAHRFEPAWLLLAAASYFLTFWARGRRYQLLLEDEGNSQGGSYLHLSLMHHLYLLILPAKAGELIFPWLGNAIVATGRTLNLIVLMVVRLFDFFFILIFVAWGLFAALLPDVSAVVAWGISAAAVVLLLLGVRYQLIVASLLHGLGWLRQQRLMPDFFSRVHTRLHEVDLMLRQRCDSSRQFALFAWTIGSWVLSAVALWSLFGMFGQAIEPGVIVFLLGGLNLIGILGFFSIGGLGIMELGLAGLLILLGFDNSTAVALGLGVRLSLVLVSIAVVLLAEAVMLTARRRKNVPDD